MWVRASDVGWTCSHVMRLRETSSGCPTTANYLFRALGGRIRQKIPKYPKMPTFQNTQNIQFPKYPAKKRPNSGPRDGGSECAQLP